MRCTDTLSDKDEAKSRYRVRPLIAWPCSNDMYAASIDYRSTDWSDDMTSVLTGLLGSTTVTA